MKVYIIKCQSVAHNLCVYWQRGEGQGEGTPAATAAALTATTKLKEKKKRVGQWRQLMLLWL